MDNNLSEVNNIIAPVYSSDDLVMISKLKYYFHKLKEFCEEWDPYGYGKLLRNKTMTSADDVRNMLVLCLQHHLGGTKNGAANGIHEITFPAWIVQKVAKHGEDPVPQDGEKPEQVLEEVKTIDL